MFACFKLYLNEHSCNKMTQKLTLPVQTILGFPEKLMLAFLNNFIGFQPQTNDVVQESILNLSAILDQDDVAEDVKRKLAFITEQLSLLRSHPCSKR